ncbi:MAG: T9SS type A sorting domain-containing protein [Ignavibacteriaceae bacterium]|nr:T9SS type A sorting domain-containing protein [Ignavibacteriaceae bacterium]
MITVKGETINYPVHLNYNGKIGAVTFFADFTEEVASFVSIESPILDHINTVQDGIIRIAWDSLEGILNNSNNYIFNFVFELKENQVLEDFRMDILPETEIADIEGTVLDGIVVNVPSMEGEMPLEYKLSQNYPNPFNPSTKIKYSLPESGRVVVKIFDVLGKEVTTLTDEYKDAGYYEIEFNAVNLASGIYLYKIVSGSYSDTKKMILLR